jgi:hypothetical protein
MGNASDKLDLQDKGQIVLGCGFCGQAIKFGKLHQCRRKVWAELKQALSIVDRKRTP